MECSKPTCLAELKRHDWLKTIMNDDETAEVILKFIQDHKYYINEELPFEVTFSMALHSWYETVYRPIMSAMYDTFLIDVYPKDMSLFTVFRSISDTHWLINSRMDGFGQYVSYTELCRERLFNMRGFWLTKLKCIFLSRA